MNVETIKAYHGTKKSNIPKILENGFKPSVSTSKKEHWLGKGIYFYEDLYYAVEWNYCNFQGINITYDKLCSNTGIIIVKIDMGNFQILDLNSGLGYTAYKTILNKINTLYSKYIDKKVDEDGDIKAIRIIEKIEEKMGIKLISDFDIVCALYYKDIFKKSRRNKGDFLVGAQKQICVKNQDVIIEKEEYNCKGQDVEQIYKLILTNRRGHR